MMSDVRGKMYDVSPPPSDFRPLSLGGLAQLARAPALQAGGQRFESVILHVVIGLLDYLRSDD